MKTYQELDWVIPRVQKQFTKNNNRSLSATFRFFKKHSSLTLIGDYPILATVIKSAAVIGIPFKRQQIMYALNFSEELCKSKKEEKMTLVDELQMLSSVALKWPRKGLKEVMK